MLMDILGVTPQQVLKATDNQHLLRKIVWKQGDRPELITPIRNYVKWLGNEMTTGALLTDNNARTYRESQERLLQSEQTRKRRVLAHYQTGRLREKQKLLAERMAAEIKLREMEQRIRDQKRKEKQDRKPKKPMRWLA